MPYLMRVELPDVPGSLGRVATAIGEAGGDIEAIEIVEKRDGFAVDDVLLEIPAGTTDKRQYDQATGTFPIDERNGEPRRIEFLPYPANYGFIPGTRMDKAQGGDGDAVDVFVLCTAVPSGTVMEVVSP